ncbi:MAG TPA: hypothetical protein VEN78_01865 [Bradyrhizobium sp.]|nr:hypothetical protein [Bradyrhizobium sp.]
MEQILSPLLHCADEKIDLSERTVFDDRTPRRDKRTPENRAILESRIFSTASLGVMSDLERILLTSVFTILGGVLVFVIGQLLSKFLIEPIHELRKVIGEVRFNLAFHAPVILTPIARNTERSDKACDTLMKKLVRSVDAVRDDSFLSLRLMGLSWLRAFEREGGRCREVAARSDDLPARDRRKSELGSG